MSDLQLLTTSSSRVYNRCKCEYNFAYEQGYAPVGSAAALNWGSAWDAGQNAIWACEAPWEAAPAIEAAQACDRWEQLDEIDKIDIEVLFRAYVEYYHWQQQEIRRVSVQQNFRCPLINPDSGRASLIWELAGVLDGFALVGGRPMITERKSSGQDISAGSVYWEKLKIDSQCSNYFAGARSLGYDPEGILYDVVRKPLLERKLATPIEARKYTKPTKAEPVSRLYAGQREFDETFDEYRDRLIADVASRPSFYFVRAEVVRLESEQIAAAKDAWLTAQFMRMSQRAGSWPRTTESCQRFNRLCPYWSVCTGSASIDDSTKYQSGQAHRELNR